ncbi:MAG: TolC family protein, partial [Saprospiraceae bacterium]
LAFAKISSVAGQDTLPVMSLSQVISTVEASYPDILKFESKILAARASVEGARAWMPPTISAGPEQFFYNPFMLGDETPMNRAGITVSIEQMIPNPWKLDAKQNYLQSLEAIEQNWVEWTKNTFRLYSKQLYYQWVVAERTLRLVQENRELLNMLIKTSEAKYPYNQSDLGNIFKAKAKIEELKNMETMLLATIAESTIGLNTLMNRDVNTNFSIDTTVVLKTYNIGLPFAADSVLRRNDIMAMQNTIESMRLDRERIWADRKPDFGIRFSHMQMFNMPPQYSIMGMMTIPIAPWSSKMYKSEVKSMDFQIRAMTHEKEGMQLMATRMINEKLAMLKYARQQLANYETGIIPAYVQNFEANLLAYNQNTGNLFVLLDSWEMLLMKRMEYNAKMLEVLKLEADYEYETEIR